MRAAGIAVALALVACASSNESGWIGSGAIPFDNAKARCQIETQTVDGPAWDTCMEALGWRRL